MQLLVLLRSHVRDTHQLGSPLLEETQRAPQLRSLVDIHTSRGFHARCHDSVLQE